MHKIKDEIQQFWTRYPCAKNVINRKEIDKGFFVMHDQIIDRLTLYHYEVYNYESCRGKVVLEIGCGMGAHARHFATFAQKFYAIDLSAMSVELANKHFELYGIKNAQIRQGDAENLDFPDNFFDRVYSNGVIHHTPDTPKVVREIYRVLKPGGEITVMVYNKKSIFYWFNLMTIGRLKYAILKLIPKKMADAVFKSHPSACELKRSLDATPWSGIPDLVLRFSDGHFNPHTKVYTKKTAAELFSKFREVKIELRGPANHFLEKMNFLGKRCGWALYVHAKK